MALHDVAHHGQTDARALHPSRLGLAAADEFPEDFVLSLAQLEDKVLSNYADNWMLIEPSFAEFEWTLSDVKQLLKKVRNTCKKAEKMNKNVLFRWSL